MHRLVPVSILRSLEVLGVVLLTFSAAHSQITNVTDDTATPIEGAGHDYIKMVSETVNPANGSVSLRIQVPVPKGRGITMPFAFSYDSNSVHHLISAYYPNYGQALWTSNIGYLSQGGWHYSVPMASAAYWGVTAGTYPNFYTCNTYSGYTFSDASGSQHALGLGTQYSANGSCPQSPVASGGDPKVLASISATVSDPNGWIPTVFAGDGTVYRFTSLGETSVGYNQQYYGLASSIEDRNGNIITAKDNGSGSFVFTDTAGRTLISSSGFGPSGATNTLSFPGLTYKVTWKTISASFSTSTPIWAGPSGEPNDTSDTCYPIPAANDSQTVISTITLPETTLQYHFYYGTDVTPHVAATNPYGLLSEIDYPSGGWVMYSWKLSDTPNELADYPGVYNAGSNTCSTNGDTYCPAPVADGCLYQYSTPVVASRQVGFGESSSPSLTQTFKYNTTWGSPAYLWTSKNTQVTSTDNVSGKNALTNYNYSWVAVAIQPYIYATVAQIPVEFSTSYYDWGNTSAPLRTEAKLWYDQFNLKSDTTEDLTTTLMSEVVYCYAGTNCTPNTFSQLKSTTEYGYGKGVVGSPLRQKVTTYQALSGTPGYIADAPCQTVVYDGNNNRYAEADYLYDGGSTLCAAITSAAATTAAVTVVSGTHDESTFGPRKATPRGNVTQKTQWASTGTSPVTTYTYDETGQVLTKTDPCGIATCSDMNVAAGSGHTTYYYYSDSYTTGTNTCSAANGPSGNTNALLTKVVYPPTNSLAHSECFSYDYNSGQLTGTQDQNGQVTTYAYSDPFFRPTQANYPDGGQNSISYSDTAPSPSVTTSTLISGSVSLGTKTVMDGMRHVVQTQTTTDPDGTDYVDTSYDGFGRVLTVSNPHRSSALPTDGTTGNTYDGLGRTTLIQRPDGSVLQTTYDQTCSVNLSALGTTVIDETGNLRETCSDGLGRLIEVDEPGTAAGAGSPGTATVSINENSGEVSNTFQVCYEAGDPPVPTCQNETVYNSGYIYLTVDGTQYSTSYGPPPPQGPYSTSYIASALASQITGGAVTAVASGSNITLTATTTGSDTNYSLSASATYNTGDDCPTGSQCFSGPSFYATAPASLTGGTNPGVGSGPLITQYTYDTLNNLTCAVQKGTDTTSFSTCASASATWRPRSFAYDSLSRLTSASNPESGTITYTYDLNGNLSTKVSPTAGQTGTAKTTHIYSYDALNRLLQETHAYASDGTVTYAYDGNALTSGCGQNPPSITSTYPIGRRTAMCGQHSGSSWSFDKMGRPLLESTRSSGSAQTVLNVAYTYNLDGSLSTLTYPSGDVVSYTVGGAGRATRVADPTNNFVTAATYAPPGLLAGMTNGSEIVTSNIYNDRLQPIWLSAAVSGQSSFFGLCYDFHLHVSINTTSCSFPAYTTGNNGNVFQIVNTVDTTRSVAFTYDALNRMSQAYTVNLTSGNCWGETYSIDAWGNLYGRGVVSGLAGNCVTEGLSATVTTQNQLSGIGMLYDAAGNVTNDGLGHTPTYDAENRIATNAGYTYSYDADGTRMEKSAGSSGTMYWQGPSGTLTETALTGTINEEYIYFNGERIARVDRPSGTVHYYFSNHLGSHTMVTSATGTCEQDIDYYPYGGVVTDHCPNVAQNYKFTGKERDTESGLDMFGARYYGSSLGRFMTPDWAAGPNPVPYASFGDPQTLNLYGYVRNNPLAKADLDGHSWWDKLKNYLGDAECWCEGAVAAKAAADNRAGQEKARQEFAKAMNSPEGKRYMMFVALYGGIYGGAAGGAAMGDAAAEGGALGNAKYAQRTFNQSFSDAGAFAGKTVDEVADALRAGELKPADVPVQYVVKDGNTLILNTRSAQALEQAGIPRSQWNAVNMTGDAAAEARLSGQLQRNNLTSAGTPTVTPEQ